MAWDHLQDFVRRSLHFLGTRGRWVVGAGGAAVVAGILILGLNPHRPVVPERGPVGMMLRGTARPIVMAFFEPLMDVSPGSSSYQSLTEHWRDIDVLAPYWFRIGWGGVLENNTSNPQVVNFSHKKGIRVWPLVGNNGFDMLTTPRGRDLATSNLVTLAQKGHYDGIVLDWELVPASQRNHFNTFVADVARAFHKRGKAVAVAVFPKIGVTSDVQGVYDYPFLAKHADAVALMTYDHHQSSSPPGAVAPLNWVSANVHYALQTIPREKLLVGVAAYGYDWGKGGVETVTTREADAILGRLGKKPAWSTGDQEPHFTYWDANGRHTVWFENARTFAQKLELVRRTHVAGVAIWRIGGEGHLFWDALPGRPTPAT